MSCVPFFVIVLQSLLGKSLSYLERLATQEPLITKG